jgi:PKD repeat protein
MANILENKIAGGPSTKVEGVHYITLNAFALQKAEYCKGAGIPFLVGIAATDETLGYKEFNSDISLIFMLANGDVEVVDALPWGGALEHSRIVGDDATYSSGLAVGTSTGVIYRSVLALDSSSIPVDLESLTLQITELSAFAGELAAYVFVADYNLVDNSPENAINIFNAMGIPFPEFSGDWTYDVSSSLKQILVDATDITVENGIIDTYSWDWGDETPVGTLATDTHIFATHGTYTVALTITLEDSTTHTISKEISMAASAITSVDTFMGAIGTEITITGTGFEAAQSTGTVKVGLTAETAIALTSITWGDTSIKGTIPALTPLGLINIYVTPAENTASSLVGGLYIMGTESFDADNIKLGLMSKMYVDGVHVGYLQDTVEIQPSSETKDVIPNSGFSVVKTFVIRENCNMKFTLQEVNASNLAMAIGAELSTDGKTVILKSTPRKKKADGTYESAVPEYAIAFTDAAGVQYYLPKAQLVEPSNIVLNSQDNMALPMSLRCLANADEVVAKIIFP